MGPVLIECQTYRFRGHVGPDDNIQGDHTDIRPPDEVEAWLQKDPITRLEEYLLDNEILDRESLNSVWHETEKEVAQAHALTAQSPLPDRKDLANYVFQEKTTI